MRKHTVNQVNQLWLTIALVAFAAAFVAPLATGNNYTAAAADEVNVAEHYGITVTEGCADDTTFKVPSTVTAMQLFSYSTGDQVAVQNVKLCLPKGTTAVYDGYGLNGKLDGQDVAFENDSDSDLQLQFNELWSGQYQVYHSAYGETVFWGVILKVVNKGQVHGTILPRCGWNAPETVLEWVDVKQCVGAVQLHEGSTSTPSGNGTGTNGGDNPFAFDDISSTCPGVGTVNCKPRDQSGDGKWMDFGADDVVQGNEIIVNTDDGKVKYTNCIGVFGDKGEAKQAVTNPWPDEIVYPVCTPDMGVPVTA